MTKATKPPVDETPKTDDLPEQDIAAGADESRTRTKDMLVKAVTKLDWHNRFQDSAENVAEKLLTAVEQVTDEAAEAEAEPASREYTTVNG